MTLHVKMAAIMGMKRSRGTGVGNNQYGQVWEENF